MSQQRQVLVVDDEAEIRSIFVHLIRRNLGFTVYEAGNIAEATVILRERTVDLLITDRKLPDGLGEAFVLRARIIRPGLKVLVVTGDDIDEELTARLQAAGVVRILPKPSRWSVIQAAVEEALRKSPIVLTVEPDREIRIIRAELFAEWGYAVRTAADGDEALGLIHDGLAPDLLVTEMHARLTDGVLLIAAAKSIRPAMKILAITGGATTEQAAAARAAGADRILLLLDGWGALRTAADTLVVN